jgi:thiosulfate/3-mercaptopyruvate sulfurtransferase
MRFMAAAVVALCAAGADNPSMIVSTDWLAAHLGDESVVVLHTGTVKDYDTGHIPGARLVTLGDISITSDRGLSLEMPPAEALDSVFTRLGVKDGVRVVIYAGSLTQAATRVWFTLDYLGWGARAALLDGGLRLWKAEGRPLSTEAPRVEPGKFTARPAPNLIVGAEWVREHLGHARVELLDARMPEYYSGEDAGGMPRAGHIPGARNVPFASVFEENGRLKPAETLRAIMRASTGPEPSLVVSYCHIGLQATVPYFVARYLGMNARLYDGSFQEWSRREGVKVDAGR